MMPELSLHILDIVNNSIRAKATLITITIQVNAISDVLRIEITDNGNGMDEQMVKNVEDPFYTTRTTRSIGLGIPFFKQAAESTGGTFHIDSRPNVGTTIIAEFQLSHIDRMPLGDITSTIHSLVTCNPDINFRYTYAYGDKQFTLDTLEVRSILGDISMNTREISLFLKQFLEENKKEVDRDLFY